jgi:hypothetical protein
MPRQAPESGWTRFVYFAARFLIPILDLFDAEYRLTQDKKIPI